MIKLKNTPEQIELVKAVGSKDPAVSGPAQEAYAAAIGPVAAMVLEQAGSASLIYVDQPFAEDESPSIPLDLFYSEADTYVTVWSQQIAGGMPTSEISAVQDLKFQTYRLDSAVSFLKYYARKHNLNVLAKATERMLNEVLVKQERQAWAVLLRAIGEASTRVNGVATGHTIPATTAGILQLDDFSRLITRNRRINSSYAGGSPLVPYSKGITDMFMSPEMKEQIRGFAFNPQNTRGVPNSDESTVLGLPDRVREEIYRSAGADEIFGVNITELNEFGKTFKYNVLFSNYAQSSIAPGGGNFSATNNEIVFGIDLTRDACIRMVETDGDTGATFVVTADDQFKIRDDRAGFYGSLREARVVIDSRVLEAVIV